MTWILLTLGAVVLVPLGFLAVRRRIVAHRLAVPANGIDESGYVRIGGVDQWVQIRGTDRTRPVLLMLHAHGASMIALTPLYSLWEKDFVVVQWDRRTVGRTRRANRRAGDAAWTFDTFVADGIELAEYLCRRLGCDRIILVGHSQGSAIGLRMVGRRPDLFHAYAGLGQMVDMARNESMAYERILARARELGNRKVADGLVALGPPPYPEPGGWIRRLRYAMAIDPEVKAWQRVAMVRVLTMPGFGPRDILGLFADVMRFPKHLYVETMAVHPDNLGLRFEVPVLLLHGTGDTYALPELAREYVERIEAPAKAYVPLAGLGHMAPFLAPERVLAALNASIAIPGSIA